MTKASQGLCDREPRWSLFGQAFRVIHAKPPSTLRRTGKLWRAVFLGEASYDAGGPYRESWSSISKEIMSTSLPLCVPCPNAVNLTGQHRETWILNPDSRTSEEREMFIFLGKLMGMAWRTQDLMDLYLSPIVWKLIVGEEVTVNDYRDIDIIGKTQLDSLRVGRCGEVLLNEENFSDYFGEMNFTIPSLGGSIVNLIPRGETRLLTWENRKEYVSIVENYRIHELEEVAHAVRQGLSTQIPPAILSLMNWDHLERCVCGNPIVDVNLLRSCTEYESYSQSDDVIQWFWEIMREFPNEDRQAFLRFTWGRSRLPLTKEKFTQKMKIQEASRTSRSTDESYPVSHTCFFSVEMPHYSNKLVMKERILYAIHNCFDIDLDGGINRAGGVLRVVAIVMKICKHKNC